jgi:hypothetical protein
MEQCPRAMRFLPSSVKFAGNPLQNIFIEVLSVEQCVLRQPTHKCYTRISPNTASIAFVEAIVVLGRVGAASSAPIQIEF